jgi:hypothetical protein
MSMNNRFIATFVVVTALSGAAAYPLLSASKPAAAEADESSGVEQSAVPVTEAEAEEPKPAKPAKAAKPAPAKRRVTRWSGGGDVVVGSSRPAGSTASGGTSRPGPGMRLYRVTRIYRDSDGQLRTDVYYEWRKE